ncbi:MAG: hypothetical protein R2810_15930 [Flavobacteriales bacterium]
MGAKFLVKYRHSRYQTWRTVSVMCFQLGFAFLLPAFLALMQRPEFYFSYFWPLDYDALWPGTVGSFSTTTLGLWAIGIGLVLTFEATPVLTFLYGKRWYCSYVRLRRLGGNGTILPAAQRQEPEGLEDRALDGAWGVAVDHAAHGIALGEQCAGGGLAR